MTMKFIPFAAGLFFCVVTSAANPPAIYPDNWIDLNKNGNGTFMKIRRSRSPNA